MRAWWDEEKDRSGLLSVPPGRRMEIDSVRWGGPCRSACLAVGKQGYRYGSGSPCWPAATEWSALEHLQNPAGHLHGGRPSSGRYQRFAAGPNRSQQIVVFAGDGIGIGHVERFLR